MNETVVTIEDAARCLPDLAERVHVSGESALLVKSGRPLVRIVPVPPVQPCADDLIAFVRCWRIEHPEPDEQFAEAIDAAAKGIRDPENARKACAKMDRIREEIRARHGVLDIGVPAIRELRWGLPGVC